MKNLIYSRLSRAIFGRGVTLSVFFYSAALLVQPFSAIPSQWDYTGSLNTKRDSYTATLLLYGKVLVAGGERLSSVIHSTELYTPLSEFGLTVAR